MAIVVLMLWISSLVAGWFGAWWWLPIPLGFMFFNCVRLSANLQKVALQNGLDGDAILRDMSAPTRRVMLAAFWQHLGLICVGALAHYVLN